MKNETVIEWAGEKTTIPVDLRVRNLPERISIATSSSVDTSDAPLQSVCSGYLLRKRGSDLLIDGVIHTLQVGAHIIQC